MRVFLPRTECNTVWYYIHLAIKSTLKMELIPMVLILKNIVCYTFLCTL